jgi:UTP--glucose-1-phosphate uridylyltransferase
LHKASSHLSYEKELVYVDGIAVLLSEGKEVYAVEMKGCKYYDCGTKLSYLKTVVELALKHQEFNGEFANFLKRLHL